MDTLLKGEVDIAVSDDDVSAFTEGGDDGGHGGESLRVDDGCFGTKEIRDVPFQIDMNVYKSCCELNQIAAV